MYDIFQSLLEAHGCTAYQVSKATGIPTATLSAWKKGKYTPKAANMQKIADYFGVDVSIFYGGMAELPQEIVYTGEIRELLKEAEKANIDDLKAVLQILKRLNSYAENKKGD